MTLDELQFENYNDIWEVARPTPLTAVFRVYHNRFARITQAGFSSILKRYVLFKFNRCVSLLPHVDWTCDVRTRLTADDPLSAQAVLFHLLEETNPSTYRVTHEVTNGSSNH